MIIYFVLCLAVIKSSAVKLEGLTTYAVASSQAIVSVTCKITSNKDVEERSIIWRIKESSGSITEKKISDSGVSWDIVNNYTKLSVAIPTISTSYDCFYVGAETNSTAIIEIIEFTTNPQNNSIVKGASQVLTCTLPDTGFSVSIQWFRGSETIGGATTSSRTSEQQVTTTGRYTCEATYTGSGSFSGGKVVSSSASIILLDFTQQPVDTYILAGQLGTLTCEIPSSKHTAEVEWYNKSGVKVQGDTGTHANSIYTSTYQSTTSGNFYCKVIYKESGAFKGGNLLSTTVTLTVIDFKSSPTTTNVGMGNSHELTCKLDSSKYTATVTWYKDDKEIANSATITQANQENIITHKITGLEDSGGTFKCKASYIDQTGLKAGSIQSSPATVTIVDVKVYNTVAEKGGNGKLECDLQGATLEPSEMTFTKDGNVFMKDITVMTQLLNNVKNMTLDISNVQSDGTYNCEIKWGGYIYKYPLTMDVIEITTESIVYGVSDSTSTLTCLLSGFKTKPSLTSWNSDTETITSETHNYLPKQTYTDNEKTLTYTLKIKKIVDPKTYTCVFVYKIDTQTHKFVKESTLKVVYIAAGSGSALQFTKGISTMSCKLTGAGSKPSEVYWKYNGEKRPDNVTISENIDNGVTTEIRYWGVDHDSNFFCHFRWGDLEIVQTVPVEVGELSLTGAVLKKGSSGKLTCSVKDFGVQPTKITWSKGTTVKQDIGIAINNTETSWQYQLSLLEFSDADTYKCSITVGNDVLSVTNDVIVLDPVIMPSSLTRQGADLILTCNTLITNLQDDPLVYWSTDTKNLTDLEEVANITNNLAWVKVTLKNVDAGNEIDYTCNFVFTKPEAKIISSNPVKPDILVFTHEPTHQYGNAGDVAKFTCQGERGNSAAGIPQVHWYSDTGLLVTDGSYYNLVIPKDGFNVTCNITYSKTSLVLSKTVSAIVSNVEAVSPTYSTVDSTSVTMECTYVATVHFDNTPTITVKWYLKNGEKLENLENVNGYTLDKGSYVSDKQSTKLTLSNVKLAHDKNEYVCEFMIDDQPKLHSVILRVLGIHLNIDSTSVAYKSGEMVSLVASPHRPDYGLNVVYRWNNGKGVWVKNGRELKFDSIRINDMAKYNVIGTFETSSGTELSVSDSINLEVRPACRTGHILNIENPEDIDMYVLNGWDKIITCKTDHLLDDQTYKREQHVRCSTTDFAELSITSCTPTCVLRVEKHDTEVKVNEIVKQAQTYNLYANDVVTTSCNDKKNRTLPSNTERTYVCSGSGTIDYTLCVDGCRYKYDDKIDLTLPTNMSNPTLLPYGESISYICNKGSDKVHNANRTYTCDNGYVNKTYIELRICSVPVPWEYIVISIAILLTILAILMIILGGYLYFKRQKQKLKTLKNGDVYTNPAAERNGGDLEMSELFKPIPIPQYHARYKNLMADDAYALSMEYDKISKVVPHTNFPITIANLALYKAKNRFVDILPYDATRVTLHPIENDPTSHYINASYVDSFEDSRRFIAAQGPKPETLIDFWRMIWEHNTHVLIMVTNFTEKGRKKCEEYWSDDTRVTYGNFSVECLGIVSFPAYKVRKLSLTCGGNQKSRIITHYHYEDWPDHGVPDAPTNMIAFAKRAFSDNLPGPIVVHCSAGVGRTGTIIALYLQMENIKKNENINIYDTVVHLRHFRKLMVQTESQYIFIYRAVNELLRCGDTEIYAQMLLHAHKDLRRPIPGTDKTGIQNEYQRLVYIAKETIVDKFTEATKEYNHHKNRYHNILPYEKNRVKLRHQTGVPGSDFINASYVSSYHEKEVFIATQAPKDGTVDDFWRMVYETRANTIIMMANIIEGGKVKCAQYWPVNDNDIVHYGACKVKLVSSEETADVTRRELCLTNSSDGYKTLRLLRMWHFTSPSEKTMNMGGLNMISIIEQISRWQKQRGNTPAVIHCSGGVGRAGAFIAIANCLEQLKLEGTVDIFQTVLNLRRSRPFMVQSLEQYDYIYKALVEYVESFDTYENFK